MSDLCSLSATALLEGFNKRTLSPVEVTKAVLARIEKLNPKNVLIDPADNHVRRRAVHRVWDGRVKSA